MTLKEFIKLICPTSSIRVLICRQYSESQVYYFVAEGTINTIFYDVDKFILMIGNPLLEYVADNEVIQVEPCNDGPSHNVMTVNGIEVVNTILTIVVNENKLQGR